MRQIKPIYPFTRPGENFIKLITHRPDFEQAIEGLRKKWKVNVGSEIDFSEMTGGIDSIDKLQKNKVFIADVRKIQKRFKLGDEWSSFVEGFVLIDFFENFASNIFIEKRTGQEGDSVTRKPSYYLRIFPETTKEDVIESWDRINEFVNGSKIKIKRQKPYKKRMRDQTIYDLAKRGMYVEDIERYCQIWFKKSLEYGTISTTINRYRKKLGIKEPCRLFYKSGGKGLLNEKQTKLAMGWPPFID